MRPPSKSLWRRAHCDSAVRKVAGAVIDLFSGSDKRFWHQTIAPEAVVLGDRGFLMRVAPTKEVLPKRLLCC